MKGDIRFAVIIAHMLPSILFFSCVKPNEADGVFIDLERSDSNLLSDRFESVDYILLESSDSTPIVRPFKIRIDSRGIFVEDRSMGNLLIFDSLGIGKGMIEPTGVGPGEFQSMEDFQVTDTAIHILDGYLQKIVSFNLDGMYLGERKLYSHPYNFYFKPGEILLNYGNKTDFDGYGIVKISTEKESKGVYKVQDGLDKIQYTSINGFMEDPHRKQVLLKMDTSYEVLIFNENLDLKEKLLFDFGKYNFDFDKRVDLTLSPQKFRYLEDNHIVENISAFFPVKNGYFMFVSQAGGSSSFIFLNEQMELDFHGKDMENDLDGMPINVMPWTYTDNDVVCLAPSSFFYQEYENAFEKGSILNSGGKVHDFVKINRDRLIDDNYVLIKLRVRA